MRNIAIMMCFFMVGCSQAQQPTAAVKTVRSETFYRLTPEGEKKMEHFTEFNERELPIFERDYMDGNIYFVYWMEYGAEGRLIAKKSSKCETCEQTTTTISRNSSGQAEFSGQEKSLKFEVDSANNRTREMEVFRNSNSLYRIKIMRYNDAAMISKKSYKFEEHAINMLNLNIDSLIQVSEPYHSIENIYNANGQIIESHWGGAVDDWFAVHKHFYDEAGRPTREEYYTTSGKSGGVRIYEYALF